MTTTDAHAGDDAGTATGDEPATPDDVAMVTDAPDAPDAPVVPVARSVAEDPWTRWAAIAAIALVVVPIAITAVQGLRAAWHPAGDWAMIELRTLDVGTRHTPLVGPYSRYAWNHPGPLLFWLYAIPYRLTGGASTSLLFTAAVVNAAAVAGMGVFAWRRGRLPLTLAVMAVTVAVVQSLGPELLWNPWNAWIPVLPFGLFLVAAFAASDGDRVALVATAAVGAFLIQTHVSFVPLVGVLALVAAAGFWRTTHDRRRVLVAVVVGSALFAPVLLDVALGSSNVADMVRYFTSDEAQPVGFGRALGIAAREVGEDPPWLGGPEPPNPVGGGIIDGPWSELTRVAGLWAAAALVGVVVLWWGRKGDGRERARLRTALRLQGVHAVTVVIGTVAVSRISDEVYDYLIRWWWPLVALGWAAAAFTLWSALWPHLPRRLGTAALLTATVLVGLAIGARSGDVIGRVGGARLPATEWYPAVAGVAPAVSSAPRDRPVLLRSSGPQAGWLEDAIVTQLAKAGVDVRLDDTNVNRFKAGSHRLTAPTEGMAGMWVVLGYRIGDFAALPGARRVAIWDPLGPEGRARELAAQQRLRDQFRAAGRNDLIRQLELGESLFFAKDVPGVNADDLGEVEAGRRAGYPVAVFLFEDGRQESPPALMR